MKLKQLKYLQLSNLENLRSPVFDSTLSLAGGIVFSVTAFLLGTFFNSIAVQINGLIGFIDIINSLIIFSAIRQSIRTPDLVYNYGYGKHESLGILLSAVFLIVISVVSVIETLTEFKTDSHSIRYEYLIPFTVVTFLFMQIMFRIQRNLAMKHNLKLLEYDSDIWKVDSYTELSVFVSLLAGWQLTRAGYSGSAPIIDSLTALLLIVFALRVPLKHGKNALNQLLDKTLPESVQYDILAAIVENIDGMCEYKGVHTRQAGKDIFIDIDVIMPFDFTLEEAFLTEKKIHDILKAKYPTAIPRLYASPCSRDCIHSGKNHCPVRKNQLKQI